MTDTTTPVVPGTTPGAAAPAARRFTIVLPAGLELINSNQSQHPRRRARIVKAIRSAAMEAVADCGPLMAAMVGLGDRPALERAHILGILHPDRGGRRDPANWYPSFKACVDGLVDAGVLEDDDHTRVLGPDMRLGRVVKGGQLVLHLRELAPGEDWPDYGVVTTR